MEKKLYENFKLVAKMALATKEKFPVANWLPKRSTGDQKISSSQLAHKKC